MATGKKPTQKNNAVEKTIIGTSISEGYSMGQAFIYRDIMSRAILNENISKEGISSEMKRITTAVDLVLQDIHEMEKQVKDTISADHAKIFTLQKDILSEDELYQELRLHMEEKLTNAEQTVKSVFSKRINELHKAKSEIIKSKTDDLYDIGRRVMRSLLGCENTILATLPKNSVIVARRLLPSDTLNLNYANVKGIIVAEGSKISHTAILAKSLGIPAVSGIKNAVKSIQNNEPLIVDAFAGKAIINPSETTKKQYKKLIKEEDEVSKQELAEAKKKTKTLDGTKITIYGNAATERDTGLLLKNGGEGIGLLRVENFYLTQKNLPDVETLYHHFYKMFEPLKNKEIVFRLLDVGGDKKIPYIHFDAETNPFLGLRGIRILLKNPLLLETQLRAAIRLSKTFNLKILIPMVTIPDEIIKIRKTLKKYLKEEKIDYDIPLGSMIETPAAVINIKEICKACDFISIGTNDLVQYTMAASRDNVNVSDYFEEGAQIIQPSIRYVVKTAKKYNTDCCLCGELANDKKWIKSFLKLGIRNISVAPFFIPKIKSVIRNITLAQDKTDSNAE